MDRDHGRGPEPGGNGVLEVPHGWTELPQQTRERHGHPEHLAPRREVDRLDSRRDEVGPAGHRRQPKVGRRERGELPQEVGHVGLVAGPASAEHVGVDDDERGAHDAASS